MTVGCTECRCDLEVCEVCERGECPDPICYRCLRAAILPGPPELDLEPS